MKPCFGYIRVSTAKQGEGASLEAQKDAITVFASQNNLKVTQWFEEKETAAKSGRPVFNKMLRLLRKGEATGLIMHKIDRSARNLKDWAIVSELPDEGVDVYIATETLDFRSRGGRLTADIQAVIAADYIRNLRSETLKGLNQRLKQGLYPFRAPIGYLDNGAGKPKTPDPIKAPLIKLMFDLYNSGQYSYRSLRVEINQRGLRNHANSPISLTGIETILKNPFYIGIIEIKRTGKTFKGIHDPIVSARVFRSVQKQKACRSGKKTTRHNHLFRGLFRCGLCDGPMTPERQKGVVYYRCQDPVCATKTIREDRLEQSVLACLKSLELKPKDAVKLEQQWLSGQQKTDREKQEQSLALRIAQEEARLSRLTDLLVDETIDKDTYHNRKKSIAYDLAVLKEEQQNLPDFDQEMTHRKNFLELMKTLTGLYIMADPTQKRILLENTISNRIVIGKKVELEPFNWLLEAKNGHGVLFGAPRDNGSRIHEEA